MISGINKIVSRIQECYDEAKRWRNEHPNIVGKIPNPFMYFNNRNFLDVYTTETYFESPYEGVMEFDYHDLGEHYAKWIEETQRRLLANRTSHERKFSQILSQSKAKVVEQPYFKIKDKGYFLDFFLPQYNLAFELNGKVHKGEDNEWYDFDRDFAFHSIGIKTVRVSNRDIDTDDIKNKINEWARAALSGNFDAALYYRRSATKKFDGKDTKYEKLHKMINEFISKKKYKGKSLLLVTDEMYFSYVFSNKRYDTSENVNKEYIDTFFDIIEQNNITFGVWNCGKMKNMSNGNREKNIERNNNATQGHIDYILRLSGYEIIEEKYPYKKVRPIQVVVLKTKEGKEYYSTLCPYHIYIPYIKKDARKKKYRKRMVYADSRPCHICKFFCGKDIERGIVLCKGFENKDSRNFFDNLNKKPKEFSEDIPSILEYIKTEEYKVLDKAIKSIEKSQRLERIKRKNQQECR